MHPTIQCTTDKEMEAYKMGEGIPWKTKGQSISFLRENEWLAWAHGDLLDENPKPALLQSAPSVVLVARTGTAA